MYAVIFHAHQKLDRVARIHLGTLLEASRSFPAIRSILEFEGQHGPDSTNLKNRAGEEQPWHFYDPYDPKDTKLKGIIQGHYDELVQALRAGNRTRAAFEAAWLAHALVDGLTPAHHYPYEEKLAHLRGGQDRHSRTTLRSRVVVKGETRRDSLRRSMALVGPKGLLTNHATFEGGAYSIIRLMNLKKDSLPTAKSIKQVETEGIVAYFAKRALVVADLKLYERYIETGWTRQLGREVRKVLVPEMIQMTTLAWYQAAKEAGLAVKAPAA